MDQSVLARIREVLGKHAQPDAPVIECVANVVRTVAALEKSQPVVHDIVEERGRQDAKFGEQNHDAGTWALILLEEIGEWAKEELDRRFKGLTRDNRRVELVQVAAVAMAMVEAMDRGGERKAEGGMRNAEGKTGELWEAEACSLRLRRGKARKGKG